MASGRLRWPAAQTPLTPGGRCMCACRMPKAALVAPAAIPSRDRRRRTGHLRIQARCSALRVASLLPSLRCRWGTPARRRSSTKAPPRTLDGIDSGAPLPQPSPMRWRCKAAIHCTHLTSLQPGSAHASDPPLDALREALRGGTLPAVTSHAGTHHIKTRRGARMAVTSLKHPPARCS